MLNGANKSITDINQKFEGHPPLQTNETLMLLKYIRYYKHKSLYKKRSLKHFQALMEINHSTIPYTMFEELCGMKEFA